MWMCFLVKRQEYLRPHTSKEVYSMCHLKLWLYHLFFLSLAQAVIRDYHRPVSLRNNHLFLTVLEAGSPRSRPWQIWCLVRAYYLACKWLSSSCFFTWEREFVVRERRSSLLFLFVKALIPFVRTVPSPHEIITSQMPHLQIPAQWALLGFQH